MTTVKCAFLFFMHSLLLQKAVCYKYTKWQRWNEKDVTFGTPMLTLESVPLMDCLITCEDIMGCISVHINKETSSCGLSRYYPPDRKLSATTRTGWTVLYKVRTETKMLRVDNGGLWGEWGSPEFCPANTFASGYIMKIESQQMFSWDDSSLNAISLICSDLEGTVIGQITSLEGPFGSWTSEEHCTNCTHLVNFQLQVDATTEKRKNMDYTGANYVKFHCSEFSGHNNNTKLVRPPGSGFWGSWGTWSESCDLKSAICGLSTRVEGDLGEGYDASIHDTALNDVIFYCCESLF